MKSEKDLKRKFENRRIEPSDQAWEQIAERLAQNQNSKRKHRLNYVAVAAGLIGIVTISAWYFYSPSGITQDQPGDTAPILVYEQPDSYREEYSKNNIVESPVEGLTIIQHELTEQHNQKAEILKESTHKIEENSKPSIQTLPSIDKVVDQQVALLLAEVSQAEQEGDAVSDETIDRLLQEAEERIASRYKRDDPGALSAVALLEDVENELDQSFRERVFDALRTGLEKAREAIAARHR